jgi:hypothetical protein
MDLRRRLVKELPHFGRGLACFLFVDVLQFDLALAADRNRVHHKGIKAREDALAPRVKVACWNTLRVILKRACCIR